MMRLKGVIRELRSISVQLERLADCWELELAHQGISVRPPKADTSGPPPTIDYVDDELEYVREQMTKYRPPTEEEEDAR